MPSKTLVIALILCLTSQFSFGQKPDQLTDTEKLYGLSKFWQEVNYNFVYLYKIDKAEWDQQYREAISQVLETKNDYEYYKVLQRLSAYLKDGHTNVWFPKSIRDKVSSTDFGDYKIVLQSIENKAIIVQINDDKKKDVPPGSEIIKINGLSTQEYIDKMVKPFISTSSPHVLLDLSVQYLLEAYEGTEYDIEVRTPKGKVKEIHLIAGASGEVKMYPEQEEAQLLEFKWQQKGVAYLAFNSFSDWKIMDLFAEIKPELHKAEKLIIDLRNNVGGNDAVARELIKYLTNDTLLYRAKSQTRQHIPAYKAWGRKVSVQDTSRQPFLKEYYLANHDLLFYPLSSEAYNTSNLNIDRIEIPTAILIGHLTASAAEDFLVYADNQEHMVTFGVPSFGSTGLPMNFELPGGGVARVCVKKDAYPDGREFVGIGIQPDVIVETSLSDFLSHKDPVLAKALEYLENLK